MMILPKGTEEIIQLLLSQNKKIDAVKLVHTLSNCGLKEAMDFVEDISRGQTVLGQTAPIGTVQDIDEEILSYLAQGKKLQAVKIYKNFARIGLAESKDYVDTLADRGFSVAHPLKSSSSMDSRDTQIDEILAKQGLKQGVSHSVKRPGSPLKRFLIILFLAIGFAFFLVYLIFQT
jgi:ribosomal protein L7/L12